MYEYDFGIPMVIAAIHFGWRDYDRCVAWIVLSALSLLVPGRLGFALGITESIIFILIMWPQLMDVNNVESHSNVALTA